MTRHWKLDFVSNKAKERILKRVLQEYKTYQIFEKKERLSPVKGTRTIWVGKLTSRTMLLEMEKPKQSL